MSAKDIFHDAVRHGLEKEGWTITADPLHIRINGVQMYIDLEAVLKVWSAKACFGRQSKL